LARQRAIQCLFAIDVGHTPPDEEIATAADAVRGKTEMDALIAYLQSPGLASRQWR